MRVSFRRLTIILCVFAGIGFLFLVITFLGGTDSIGGLERSISENCEQNLLQDTLKELCTGYNNGSVVGTLCGPLCDVDSVKITRCIHHHTTIVMLGTLNGKPVALKKKAATSRRGDSLKYYRRLFNEATSWESQLDVLKHCLTELLSFRMGNQLRTLNELHVHLDSILKQYDSFMFPNSSAQLFEIWEHFEDDEFAFYSFYNDFEHFPKIVGTCGLMYGVDQAISLGEFVPSVGKSSVPWQQRIIIALSLLNMIPAMEKATLGPLHHCDIQISNFGVSDKIDAVAIDVDMIFSHERMADILSQPNCTTDDQCDFFDCLSICNTTSNRCTSVRKTNNLQQVCGKLLFSKYFGYGLIGDILPKINPTLTSLLNECASTTFGYLSFNDSQFQNVYNSIRDLLVKEL